MKMGKMILVLFFLCGTICLAAEVQPPDTTRILRKLLDDKGDKLSFFSRFYFYECVDDSGKSNVQDVVAIVFEKIGEGKEEVRIDSGWLSFYENDGSFKDPISSFELWVGSGQITAFHPMFDHLLLTYVTGNAQYAAAFTCRSGAIKQVFNGFCKSGILEISGDKLVLAEDPRGKDAQVIYEWDGETYALIKKSAIEGKYRSQFGQKRKVKLQGQGNQPK